MGEVWRTRLSFRAATEVEIPIDWQRRVA